MYSLVPGSSTISLRIVYKQYLHNYEDRQEFLIVSIKFAIPS